MSVNKNINQAPVSPPQTPEQMRQVYNGCRLGAHVAFDQVKNVETLFQVSLQNSVKDSKKHVSEMHKALVKTTQAAEAIIADFAVKADNAIADRAQIQTERDDIQHKLDDIQAEKIVNGGDLYELVADKQALAKKVTALEAENFNLIAKAGDATRQSEDLQRMIVRYKAAAIELATLLHVTRKEAYSFVKAGDKKNVNVKLEAAEMGAPSEEELAKYLADCGVAAPTLARQLGIYPSFTVASEVADAHVSHKKRKVEAVPVVNATA